MKASIGDGVYRVEDGHVQRIGRVHHIFHRNWRSNKGTVHSVALDDTLVFQKFHLRTVLVWSQTGKRWRNMLNKRAMYRVG